MSYGSQTRNPYEHDDHLSCDFGCDGPAEMVKVDGHTTPLCGACESDKTDTCAGCQQRFWIGQMTATFSTDNLYCPPCHEEHAQVREDLLRAARIDEDRDDFMDQVRR